MSSARRPLPTDIVALVSFDGRVYPNEAKPLDRLGLSERTHPLENALEQWFSFATQKHTWISVRGATIRGLISARPRGKRTAWEVEVLINVAEDESVAQSLFGRMTAGIAQAGGERVFLRLEASSPLLHAARCAGFFTYSQERLYKRAGGDGEPTPELMRPKARGDVFGIYQLYSRTVPANVRAIEGATFREWQAAQERWNGRPLDLIEEEDGLVKAWLRVAPGRTGRLALLVEQGGDLEGALRTALSRLAGSRRLLTLVPHYNTAVAQALECSGFEPVGEYVTLAKRLAKPAEELVKEASSTAVPVN